MRSSDLEADYKISIGDCIAAIGWVPERHEDKVRNYIPDFSFAGDRIDGWIEAKYQRTEPTSLGAIAHYTRGQENWLRERGKHGSGNCYLLLGTPHANFLWRWDVLGKVRNLKFEDAVHYCYIVDVSLYDLFKTLAVRVRIR